ncbi:protein Mis18-beta [Hoplias malabaricus]|uniref:protein Mis18-beta n=1 Tax=Hoplias malabaricus TaxID=27720 RepID=UPI00346264D9
MSYGSRHFLSNHNFECESIQSTIVIDQLKVMEDNREHIRDYEKCCVLHCAKCSTVMADSLGICGEAKPFKSLICLKVTNDVRVKGKLEMSLEGPLAFCTYRLLECKCCHRCVGVVLHSTPAHFSSLRDLFLLRKDMLNCYILKNSTVVKASKVSFDPRPLTKHISELKQELEAQLKQVDIVKEMLGDVSIPRVDRHIDMTTDIDLPQTTTTLTSGFE